MLTIALLSFLLLGTSIYIGYGMWKGNIKFGWGFFVAIDNLSHGFNNMFGRSAATKCRLETAIKDEILITDSGSLLSIIEIHGSSTIVGEEEILQIIKQYEETFGNKLNKHGYTQQIVMSYDPDEAKFEIERLMEGSRNTSKSFGLDLDSMFDDWEETLAKYCASEHVYLAFWSSPVVLTPALKKESQKTEIKNIQKYPRHHAAQLIGKGCTRLLDEHESFIKTIVANFKKVHVLSSVLDAHEAIWVMRRIIDKPNTGADWKPLLPGDKFPMRFAELGEKNQISGLLFPKIGTQIFNRSVLDVFPNLVRVGTDVLHGTMSMKIPPQNPQPFNVLFKHLLAERIPYRIGFLMQGDGLAGRSLQNSLALFFKFASYNNKLYIKSIDDLKERKLNGDVISGFQCTFGTSVSGDTNIKNSAKIVSERLSILGAAMQSWGSSDVNDNVGEPLLGLNSTVPGLMPTSPAPKAAGPLHEIALMLPLTRPASLWKNGNTLFRSSDGKLMPYKINSTIQSAAVDVGIAPMGGGKSVLLNTLNFGFCLQDGLTRLPMLSLIDIGPSSSGIVEIIKSGLPDNLRYLAQYHRLRMEPRYSVNVFDLPLGFRKPTPIHRTFLTNFLTLLATPTGEYKPIEGTSAIARSCIDACYEEFLPKNKPKLYQRNINKDVDKMVDSLNLSIDDKTSWFEICDLLFENNYIHEATIAQRYAVPVLAEIANMAKRDIVTGIYRHETTGGELVTTYFWRQCLDAISAYPILKNTTQFSVADARIISLDLDEVAPRGGAEADKQTAVMYMLGRHIVASKFFLMPNDALLSEPLYVDWVNKNIENTREDPKRLAYDEVHRAVRNESIASQIIGDIEIISRESRKWNLSLGLYSQSIDDIPVVITDLATTLYVMGSGSVRNSEKITKVFGLNNTALEEMQKLGQPDKRGANFLGIFKVGSDIHVHRLTNTIGQQALWAFDTNPNNTAIRNKLYIALGVSETLKRLSRLYPGGAHGEVEKRRSLLSKTNIDGDKNLDIISDIIKEVINFDIVH